MSAAAKAAGVATGTAYVHYDSKDQLIYATYLEVKREMGVALEGVVDPNASAHDRFVQLWTGIYRHLADDPDRA
jgi:AcrR family transcriptional regulator